MMAAGRRASMTCGVNRPSLTGHDDANRLSDPAGDDGDPLFMTRNVTPTTSQTGSRAIYGYDAADRLTGVTLLTANAWRQITHTRRQPLVGGGSLAGTIVLAAMAGYRREGKSIHKVHPKAHEPRKIYDGRTNKERGA